MSAPGSFIEDEDKALQQVLQNSTEFGARRLSGWQSYLIAAIAGGWSLFQLALPKFLYLNADYVRAIHLAFAIALVYLCFPAFRKQNRIQRWVQSLPRPFHVLLKRDSIPWVDLLLAILASTAVLYYWYDYTGIAERQGLPITRDLVIGVVTTLLLLEAARRSLGPFLPLVALLFIVYSFFSESMPEILAFKNASLSKIVSKLTLTSEGIYGVPLDVSASTVFLFVLFGAMLDKAGGGKYFIELAFSLLGRFKGGPAKAAVLASGFTGMVSGSSIANTVTTGTFTIPLMKKTGYPAIKAGAIEVAASTNGQLMPPIMGAAAFIIAEYCNVDYFEVVRAAFIPAFISYITLIYITHLEASKLGLKGIPKEELPLFWQTLARGSHFMIPLGFLLYQLIVLRRSPQLSAYYAILALAALVLMKHGRDAVRNQQSWLTGVKQGVMELWDSLVVGGRNMMSIGVAVATAGIIVGIVTLGLGAVITDLIDLLSGGNLVLLLIITAIASLILGMGLPTTANYIVMATLTVPVIVVLGEGSGLQVPLLAAHLFCFYFGILADDTPPVALAAYAASAISKADPIRTGIQGFTYDLRTAILPFMFIFNTDLLLIGVHSWEHIALVFTTALLAMFAFASVTQNHLRVKNQLHETGILSLTTLLLLRPDLASTYFGITTNLTYAIGIGLFGFVYALQSRRYRAV